MKEKYKTNAINMLVKYIVFSNLIDFNKLFTIKLFVNNKGQRRLWRKTNWAVSWKLAAISGNI